MEPAESLFYIGLTVYAVLSIESCSVFTTSLLLIIAFTAYYLEHFPVKEKKSKSKKVSPSESYGLSLLVLLPLFVISFRHVILTRSDQETRKSLVNFLNFQLDHALLSSFATICTHVLLRVCPAISDIIDAFDLEILNTMTFLEANVIYNRHDRIFVTMGMLSVLLRILVYLKLTKSKGNDKNIKYEKGCCSKGEAHILLNGYCMLVVDYIYRYLVPNQIKPSSSSLFLYVSHAAIVGCISSCIFVSSGSKPRKKLHDSEVLQKFVFITTFTLVSMEVATIHCGNGIRSASPLQSMEWLAKFVLYVESSLYNIPRVLYLLGWLFVLFFGLYLSVFIQNIVASRTVQRKYFHLLAIAMFLPVSMADQEFMCFSYAAAFCVLICFECLRYEITTCNCEAIKSYEDTKIKGAAGGKETKILVCLLHNLNSYYNQFLDPAKDVITNYVITHIALLVGCFIPLYTHCILKYTTQGSYSFLALLGIYTIGIGDAEGAIVGVTFGKTLWSSLGLTSNNRTVEGSLAMFLSMIVASRMFEPNAPIDFTLFFLLTMLEAVTSHLDNLILPFTGVILILIRTMSLLERGSTMAL